MSARSLAVDVTMRDDSGGRRKFHSRNFGGRDVLVGFVENNNDDTTAWTSIEDVAACAGAVDAQIQTVLGRVLAQRRSVQTAFDYVVGRFRGSPTQAPDGLVGDDDR